MVASTPSKSIQVFFNRSPSVIALSPLTFMVAESALSWRRSTYAGGPRRGLREH